MMPPVHLPWHLVYAHVLPHVRFAQDILNLRCTCPEFLAAYRFVPHVYATDVVSASAVPGCSVGYVKWLLFTKGESLPWNAAFSNAATLGNLELVTWLHEMRRSFSCARERRRRSPQTGRRSALSIDRNYARKRTRENESAACVHWVYALGERTDFGRFTQEESYGDRRLLRAATRPFSAGRKRFFAAIEPDDIPYSDEEVCDAVNPEDAADLAMDRAASNGHLHVLRFLDATGCYACSTIAMDWAALNNHMETVIWLHHNREEGCTQLAMDCAASNGHFEMVKWLHAHRSEGCTVSAIDWAASNGYAEICRWLLRNRNEGFTANAVEWAELGGHHELACELDEVRNGQQQSVTHAT